MFNDTLGLHDVERTLRTYLVDVTLAASPFNVVFNTLLISVICIYRKLHNVQDGLIAVIACFDMLYALFIIPLYALPIFDITIFTGNKYGCIGMYSIILMVVNGRCIFFQWLTLDRYTAIRHTFWYMRHVTFGNFLKYCGGFVFAYLVVIGSLPMLGVHCYSEGNCNRYKIWPYWFEIVFYSLVELFAAFIPTILNIRLLFEVKSTQKILKRLSYDPTRSDIREANSIRVSMSIYFAYLIFYLPVCISTVLRTYQRAVADGEKFDTDTILYIDYIATIWQWGFLGIVNPLLMFYLKKDYRTGLRIMLKIPCWRWSVLKHDKLGHDFSTSHGSSSAQRSSRFSSRRNTPTLASMAEAGNVLNQINQLQQNMTPTPAPSLPQTSFFDVKEMMMCCPRERRTSVKFEDEPRKLDSFTAIMLKTLQPKATSPHLVTKQTLGADISSSDRSFATKESSSKSVEQTAVKADSGESPLAVIKDKIASMFQQDSSDTDISQKNVKIPVLGLLFPKSDGGLKVPEVKLTSSSLSSSTDPDNELPLPSTSFF